MAIFFPPSYPYDLGRKLPRGFVPSQNAFRFYADGTESGSSALDTQNTNIAVNLDGGNSVVLLRILLQELSGFDEGLSTDDFQLYFSHNLGSYVQVGAGTAVSYYNSSNLTEGESTTNRLTGGSGAFVTGKVTEDAEVNDLQLTIGNYTELLYSLILISSQLNNNATLDYKIYYNNIELSSYNVIPRITIIKSKKIKDIIRCGLIPSGR